MNKIFLISNAHIDPVWLWEWPEGATATVATFRAAADFCEEFDGYIFCHNEALLYQWTQEYDPVLFARIQRLVTEGKWHIMGGWFLQPDCNIPSGESILRQIVSGQNYFAENFGKKPTVAVNFDTFGHSRGMVQILSQCGYKGYVFMRPESKDLALPSHAFTWKGFDESTITCYRLPGRYGNLMGEAAQNAQQWSEKNADQTVGMFCWGVGNHGGGASRQDLNDLAAWMDAQKDIQISHSTPEAFFDALADEGVECPEVAQDLRPVFVGCYTSQARVKQLHRKLENELLLAEKMASAASSLGLMEYPKQELEQAQWDMLINEFHDTLPGTTIESGAKGAQQSLAHGLEICGRVKMRAFMALIASQSKAKPMDVPVFIYNPHPYPVTGVFCCEFMPQDQNWETERQYRVTVTQNGQVIPVQMEKPEYNMNLDWRIKISFYAKLQPSAVNRFDCQIDLIPVEREEKVQNTENIVFTNDRMSVTINKQTGLVDAYSVDGVSYLKKDSFATVLYADSADPWKMESNCYTQIKGQFVPIPERIAPKYSITEERPDEIVPAVRIVEDGPVRMLVEAEFVYGQSKLIQTYILPKKGTAFEIEQRFYWNEADTMAKLVIPCTMAGEYIGQNMFGSGKLKQDGTEQVSQKWCGLFGSQHALTVCNTATYGSHASEDTMYLSLLRAPAYAAHPIPGRSLIHEDRFVSRVDQGEHVFSFKVCAGTDKERRSDVDREAQLFNEPPYVLSAFPGGNGTSYEPFISVFNENVILSAMQHSKQGDLVIRLWNANQESAVAKVSIPSMDICTEVTLPGSRFQTYIVRKSTIIPTKPL